MTSLMLEFPPLQMPATAARRRGVPAMKPRQLVRWAAQLPRGRHAVCVEQALVRLRELNGHPYPVTRRERLLGVLAPVADELAAGLVSELNRVTVPLSVRTRANAAALDEVLEALIGAYKLLTRQWVGQVARRGTRPASESHRMLAAGVHRIMDLLGQRLLNGYRLYGPAPSGVWRELHLLYRYAEERALHRIKIAPTHTTCRSDCIHTTYLRLLLLALAEPASLMPDEIETLYQWLAEHAGACALTTLERLVGYGEFVVDFGLDRPPRFVSDAARWQAADARVIELTPLRRRVEQQLQPLLRAGLERQGSRGLQQRQQRDLLLRLAETWQGGRARKMPRRARPGRVSLTLGLLASHASLYGTRRYTPAMDELKLHGLQDTVAASEFARVFRQALEADKRNAGLSAPIWSDWQRTNISGTGLGLHHNHESCPPVRPGELVVYRPADSVRPWHIGVIRWLRSESEGGLDIGVSTLGRHAIAVSLRGLSGPATGVDYTRGLLLALRDGTRTVPTLLTSETRYDIGCEVLVNDGRQLRQVRLTRLRLVSRHFAQFDYQTLAAP